MNICPHCLAMALFGMGFAIPWVKAFIKKLELSHAIHSHCHNDDCCKKK